MKRLIILLFPALAAAVALQAQVPTNPALARSMDSIFKRDQLYRQLLYAIDTNQVLKDSIARAARIPAQRDRVVEYLVNEMAIIDSANLRFIDSIIKKQGYPGKTVLGAQKAFIPWLIIHHADPDVLAAYMPVFKEAVDKGEMLFANYAYSLDRMLVGQGKEQRYGSQVAEGVMKKTGKKMKFIWPLEEPARVNERRKTAGIDGTIEEYARLHGFEYQVVKLGDFRMEEE
ncbi:hypothetical protein EGT74_07595 [Chitinophaga lutea]|uniref:DUF4919 domain-containing protein n=1 Tax=Chitinophaga lutea TaxID=2488634 RepID=A0A3N4QBL5_9BACT|nr:DUF6624 domain-containing protein [Chitinophaga lutea]RPE13380.1 hypothetical protein EGT74_07595 [Chitinophaga lutea]